MKISMKPTTAKFKLDCDPEGVATVTIRQMTNGDYLKRARMTEKQSWSNDIGLTIKWNGPEIQRHDAYLTLVGADLEDEDTGAPLFRFKDGKNGSELAMSENEFNAVWDSLPRDLADEIYDHIKSLNSDIAGTGE